MYKKKTRKVKFIEFPGCVDNFWIVLLPLGMFSILLQFNNANILFTGNLQI